MYMHAHNDIRFEPGPSSSPVWIENLNCSTATYTCTHSGYGNTNCTHKKDVAVYCLAGKYSALQVACLHC